LVAFNVFSAACGNAGPEAPAGQPTAMSQVPAVRLSFRYEADVPPPEIPNAPPKEERSAPVQADFDQNRGQELLDRTVFSPDRKRVLAVYHRVSDLAAEYRLDMYTAEGGLLKKVTSDLMAVHFPDTIRWAPDSSAAAFVAMVRAAGNAEPTPTPPPVLTDANTAPQDPNANTAVPVSTPTAPVGILTFRTEQLYITNADGDGTKPVTQNEGLIYFYYVWSPDSTMLAALATTAREWQFLDQQANSRGEMMVPQGRPRVVEKNGRERRLDDALTGVQPVWSPDSSKVAVAFDKQIRIYDAAGTSPTQAAVPLRNYLLISSQAYDREQQAKLEAANTGVDVNQNAANTNQVSATLPDEASLVSFNPIVALNWTADELLYFQTAFVKRMRNESDSVTSFQRWHRLVLSAQATK
jgi:hypothetical protein